MKTDTILLIITLILTAFLTITTYQLKEKSEQNKIRIEKIIEEYESDNKQE